MKQFNLRIAAILVALFGIVLVSGFIVILKVTLEKKTTESDYMLIGRRDHDSLSDLFLARLSKLEEKPYPLDNNVLNADISFSYFTTAGKNDIYSYIMPNGQPMALPVLYYSFGKFIPESDTLLYWYRKDNEIFINSFHHTDDKPIRLLDSKASFVEAMFYATTEKTFIKEWSTKSSQLDIFNQRCIISSPEKDTNIVAKGINCFIADDGNKMLVFKFFKSETNFGTDAILVDTDSGNEKPLMRVDGELGLGGAYSFDLSRLAYIKHSDDKEKLVLVNTENGNILAESDWFVNLIYSDFSYKGNTVFYISQNTDGDLDLSVMDEKGVEKIATGLTMTAKFNEDGSYLVYMVEEENDEHTIYSYSIEDRHIFKIATGTSLTFNLIKDRIILRQIDDFDLLISSVGFNGQDKVELYTGDNDESVQIYHVPNENLLFLFILNDQGITLFITPIDQDTGFELLDDWESINLLNLSPDGQELVFAGKEMKYDDLALFVVSLKEGSYPIKLDDNFDNISNAVLAPKGDKVIYSINYEDNRRDPEIRRTTINGKQEFDTLYDDFILYDVQWDELYPFQSLIWENTLSSIPFCSNISSLANQAKVNWDGIRDHCFRVHLEEGTVYTISVENQREVYMSLYDQRSNQLEDFSDPRMNPNMVIIPDKDGVYFVKVVADSSIPEGEFLVKLNQGLGEPAFEHPTILIPGAGSKIGHVSSGDYIEVEKYRFTTYGKVYAFKGKKGQKATIEVHGGSIGSKIDPEVFVFSSGIELLGSDDDSGDGSDSRLSLTLPSDGWYFVLIRSINDNFGSDYFYEVLLTVD
jgi:hypothetical protein